MVRFKHRYLLVHLLFPNSLPNPFLSSLDEEEQQSTAPASPTINEAGLISLLRDSLSVNFGDVGAGEVGGSFAIKYLSPHTNLLILRVSREHYRTLWAALTLLRRVGGHEVIARVLHVGGTIRKTQHAAIAIDREEILERAAVARRARRRALKGKGAVAAAVAAGAGQEDVEDQADVEKRLEESEKALMAMEA